MIKILCETTDQFVLDEVEKLTDRGSDYGLKKVSNSDEMLWSFVSGNFDVYIVDGGLRCEKAIGLCKAIRAADEDGMIVCLSSNETYRFKALDAGADIFLRIPDQLYLLCLRIEDLFHALNDRSSSN